MTGDWLCGDIKSATAPIVMEVSVPSFAPPRVLSRLASEVDSAAPGAVGPVALWVVEQVVHLVDGRDAAELPVVRVPSAPEVALLAAVLPAVGRLVVAPPAAREPFQLAAALLAVEQPVVHEPSRLAAVLPAVEQLVVREPCRPAVVLPAGCGSCRPAAVLPAVVRPVAREPCRPAAVLPAGRGSFPLAAVLPAVGRPVAREPYRLAAAVLKVAGRCELVESYPPAHSPLAHWAACSLVCSLPAHWRACSQERSATARSQAAWSCPRLAG